MVTYRDATKRKWLGVPDTVLARHTAVSEAVARLMVIGSLAATPEADLAASVTGHLGPDAPPDQDGLVYIGMAERDVTSGLADAAAVRRHRLTSQGRLARQREAVGLTLDLLIDHFAETGRR
jgi:nicotinamide mononucleotide (NMN) deamidase PncC